MQKQPNFNHTHPELQEGEKFWQNILVSDIPKEYSEQSMYRAGKQAYTYAGEKLSSAYAPLFVKDEPAEKPPGASSTVLIATTFTTNNDDVMQEVVQLTARYDGVKGFSAKHKIEQLPNNHTKMTLNVVVNGSNIRAYTAFQRLLALMMENVS